jgi:pilus assembly protein CpaE
MVRLSSVIVSDDNGFRSQLGALLRAAAFPVRVTDDRFPREGLAPDVVVVDGRAGTQTTMQTVERVRIAAPTANIFFVAQDAAPELILHSMRAGANEFLTWPPARETLDDAIRRMAARLEAAPGDRSPTTTLAFFGAKGGVGTTTVAVNCAVEIARLGNCPTLLVDLKPGLGEASLFLGLRSRYTLLDALDNVHRLDAEFLRELVVKHKSGLELLAGSAQFERPGPGDSGAIEEIFKMLGRYYEYIVIDVGNEITPCATAALYASDLICLVTNPDVPSVRNAQRLLEKVSQLGASSDRVRVVLNRAAEPFPIPLAQIESALGHEIAQVFPSDYKVVSSALNSGVPLALTGNTDLAAQFDRFTRTILNPHGDVDSVGARRGGPLRLERIMSIW